MRLAVRVSFGAEFSTDCKRQYCARLHGVKMSNRAELSRTNRLLRAVPRTNVVHNTERTCKWIKKYNALFFNYEVNLIVEKSLVCGRNKTLQTVTTVVEKIYINKSVMV